MAAQWIRFTDSCRQALVHAQAEAQEMGHRYIGTEHVLLGLLREPMSVAAGVLAQQGILLERTRARIRAQAPARGSEALATRLDLSPAAKRALQRAASEAQSRQHELVGTEHLMLGLLHQTEGAAARLLLEQGVSPEIVEEGLTDALKSGSPGAQPAKVSRPEELEQRYQVEEVIGVGSFSTVYRARDLSLEDIVRRVAIKEMQYRVADPQRRAMIYENFRREAAILASLKHPFIPKFFDFFGFEDRLYLVMEYIDGRNLEELLAEAQQPLPIRSVLKWAVQICDVLHYLHHHRPAPIVFQDLNPSNIMIERHNNIRLIDFNIAGVFERGATNPRLGTEGYAAPEQYRGEATPRGDIYGLGATLHHLLTNRDPRMEPPFSFAERPASQFNHEVSPELEAVLLRALSYAPEDRFTQIGELKSALIRAAGLTSADLSR